MHHGADVDAEHALRGDARAARHAASGATEASASTMPTTSAANSAADGTPSDGRAGGGGDGEQATSSAQPGHPVQSLSRH